MRLPSRTMFPWSGPTPTHRPTTQPPEPRSPPPRRRPGPPRQRRRHPPLSAGPATPLSSWMGEASLPSSTVARRQGVAPKVGHLPCRTRADQEPDRSTRARSVPPSHDAEAPFRNALGGVGPTFWVPVRAATQRHVGDGLGSRRRLTAAQMARRSADPASGGPLITGHGAHTGLDRSSSICGRAPHAPLMGHADAFVELERRLRSAVDHLAQCR
jgi:hypothetical protein